MELMIGRVIKSHGIRGEVSVDVTTDEPELRFALGEVLHGRQANRERDLTIASARPHKGRLLLTFEEIADRTEADALRGMRFFAEPLEDEEDDGFYDHQLEGLRVLREGEDIGEVTGVMHVGPRTTLEVRLAGGKEAMIPFVHDIVPEIDLAAGTVIVTPPEGLLEL